MTMLLVKYLAASSLAIGAVGTTTTTGAAVAPGTPMTTTSGSMTLAGLDFSALTDTMKASISTQVIASIASACGVATSAVEVTLSAGSVLVEYTVTTPTSSASSVLSSLTTAISSGTLASDVVSRVSSISGISSALSGSLSVTNLTTPTQAAVNTNIESSEAILRTG